MRAALSIRAMWHLGENRLNTAWQDVLALHRLSRLLSQGYTLIEQLVAIAINGIACDATVSLLDHRELTPDRRGWCNAIWRPASVRQCCSLAGSNGAGWGTECVHARRYRRRGRYVLCH